MRGYVYIMTDPTREGLVKVGYSAKDPRDRAKELSGTSTPLPLVVEYEMLIEDARAVEQTAHRALRDLHVGKEWFRCRVEAVITVLRQLGAGRVINEFFHKANRQAVAALETERRVAREAADRAAAEATKKKAAFDAAKQSSAYKIRSVDAFRANARATFERSSSIHLHTIACALVVLATLVGCVFIDILLVRITLIVLAVTVGAFIARAGYQRHRRARLAYDAELQLPSAVVALTPLEKAAHQDAVQKARRAADERNRLYAEFVQSDENLRSELGKWWGIAIGSAVLIAYLGNLYRWKDGSFWLSFGVLALWLWAMVSGVTARRNAATDRYRRSVSAVKEE